MGWLNGWVWRADRKADTPAKAFKRLKLAEPNRLGNCQATQHKSWLRYRRLLQAYLFLPPPAWSLISFIAFPFAARASRLPFGLAPIITYIYRYILLLATLSARRLCSS